MTAQRIETGTAATVKQAAVRSMRAGSATADAPILRVIDHILSLSPFHPGSPAKPKKQPGSNQ